MIYVVASDFNPRDIDRLYINEFRRNGTSLDENNPKKMWVHGSCRRQEIEFTIKTFQEVDPVLSERDQSVDHLQLADNFHNLFTLSINILHLWCRRTHVDHLMAIFFTYQEALRVSLFHYKNIK